MAYSKKWLDYFIKGKMMWMHDGDSTKPHVVLRSGLHSRGYFNSTFVTESPRILGGLVSDLRERFSIADVNLNDVDWVVGSAMGAVTMAYEFARQCSTQHHSINTAYAEKCRRGGEPAMKFRRHHITKSAGVLVVEDTITSGGSTLLVFEALRNMGIEPMPMVATILNRSGKQTLSMRGPCIVSLVEEYMPMWTPAECPLCQAGSPILNEPKTTKDWCKLTRK